MVRDTIRTVCDRCGWPVEGDDVVMVARSAGTIRVVHSFCVPRPIDARSRPGTVSRERGTESELDTPRP
jgi:hypothetical protein